MPLFGETQLTGNICVFASGSKTSEEFSNEARRLGELIGEHNFGLVYGGIEAGLMKEVADAARGYNVDIIGVLPGAGDDPYIQGSDLLEEDENAQGSRTIYTRSLAERKYRMLGLSDAVVALPGGFGTLDEIATSLERMRFTSARGALSRFVVLNSAGYYDGLRSQLELMRNEQLVRDDSLKSIFFEDSADAAMKRITQTLKAPKAS